MYISSGIFVKRELSEICVQCKNVYVYSIHSDIMHLKKKHLKTYQSLFLLLV